MNDQAGPTTDDRRDEFLRSLAERTERIGRRVDRFLRSGWDINGLALLHAEAKRLREDSARNGVDEVDLPLEKLAVSLEQALAEDALPDVELGGRICELVQQLDDAAPEPPALPELPPPPEPQVDLMAHVVQVDVQQARAHAEELFRSSGDAWGDGGQLFGKLPRRESGEISMPEARVVWLRRDPGDVALSAYRSFFATSVPWSWRWSDIAHHMMVEDRLRAHWAAEFP